MAHEGTVSTAEKFADKVSSALEKITEVRSLILGATFILYIDLWLIEKNINPYLLSFEAAVRALSGIAIGNALQFLLSYSLLMAIIFPFVRHFGGVMWLHTISMWRVYEGRRKSEKQLSDWSLGLIIFSIANGIWGLTQNGNSYHGVIHHISHALSEKGLIEGVFFLGVLGLLFLCVESATRIDI